MWLCKIENERSLVLLEFVVVVVVIAVVSAEDGSSMSPQVATTMVQMLDITPLLEPMQLVAS